MISVLEPRYCIHLLVKKADDVAFLPRQRGRVEFGSTVRGSRLVVPRLYVGLHSSSLTCVDEAEIVIFFVSEKVS